MAATDVGPRVRPSRISALPSGVARPRWSVMIPTYNCAEYLRVTLASVLEQDPGPDVMQIEVVDDCSTRDDPEAVVAELGSGRVAFFRHARNVGHIVNFDTCLQRSRGRLVHLLHGDDYVRPGFYRALEHGFVQRPEIGAAFCRQILMDERGNWRVVSPLERPERGVLTGWVDRLAVGQRLQPPSIAVRREVYERLGGFDPRIRRWSEDWEMWLRIAAHYPVWYEPEPLAVYRMHGESITSHAVLDPDSIRECCRIVSIAQSYLPADRYPQLARQAREECVLGAYRRLRRRLAGGQIDPLSRQHLAAAVWCSRSPRAVLRMLLLYALWWRARSRPA
ncbi:MAG TPA: glycosyltransferase [Solirubrobacteraceae bacterium]|nr:glycosyltransferase [Solirubrobacteraceae bacterium]